MEWKFSADEIAKRGPWYEANKFCLDLEAHVNDIIEQSTSKGTMHVTSINFGNPDTLDINQDFDILYDQLDHVDEDHKMKAKNLKANVQDEIRKLFIPKLQKLEMILLLNAFNLKGRPIIDLFHKFENKVRVMRSPEEFSNIMGGGFMALFYKVCMSYFVYTMFLHV